MTVRIESSTSAFWATGQAHDREAARQSPNDDRLTRGEFGQSVTAGRHVDPGCTPLTHVFLRGPGEVGGYDGHGPVDQRGNEHVEYVLSNRAHSDSVDVRMGRPQLFEQRIKCFCPGRGCCGHAKGPYATSSVFGGRPTSDQRPGESQGDIALAPEGAGLTSSQPRHLWRVGTTTQTCGFVFLQAR